ncbi:MAG: hypothetical protein AB7I18_02830 [Candidatus Berkiella sp.]
MYYLGAMVAATGVYFAFQTYSKRTANPQPFTGPASSLTPISGEANADPLVHVEFYQYLHTVLQGFNHTNEGFLLPGTFEDFKRQLQIAPLEALYDPRFNADKLYDALKANSPTEDLSKHIKGLSASGLNQHAEILHNLVHLGCILHQDNQGCEDVIAEILTPFFLPILGKKEPILLTDYLTVKYSILTLVKSDYFKSPYCDATSASRLCR